MFFLFLLEKTMENQGFYFGRAQDGPRRTRLTARHAQDGPRAAPRRFKTAQDSARSPKKSQDRYVSTYIHYYVSTYTHAYIHTYLHTLLSTYRHYYLSTYIHAYILTYIHRYIHTDINTYIKYLRGGPRYHNHLRMYVAEVGLSPGCSFLTS